MMLKVLLPPIVVPIIAFGFMYSETIWKKKHIKYLDKTRYLPIDDDEKKEMEEWSSDNKLRINDPDYNPFAPKLRR